ncbi:hypothetical protein JCM19037_4010 [Geomicrobium sp. JCM 19037]|uniref:DUF1206 domain-containing protein n=1 Tax=Geomicrobium sp. JCM 19037 TaxID=1460634 RepID=UPI00045F1F99|nr:DUF1206 domain-containing protein [Geomicrobium sp. JCM 19037]GAK05507.1 hypothetical protein JCM19037_4010 [Geomicrobium sp. JCM 19037]
MISWVDRFARFGYMCQGTVFILIGILAFMAAAGVGGDTENTTGALHSLAKFPFGQFLLFAIGTGLIGFIMFMCLKTFKDIDRNGTAVGGLVQRGSHLLSAGIYTFVSVQAFRIAMSQNTNSEYSESTVSSYLLAQPFGAIFVVIIGLIIIATGLFQVYSGLKERHMDGFKVYEMTPKEQHFAAITGKIGFSARGIIFVIIGYFFTITAIRSNPDEAQGFDDALATLQDQPFGGLWLGIVAVGVIAFGIYAFVRAHYEHIRL